MQLADVSLINGGGANVRAGGGGSIAINARNLDILDASNLRAGIASGVGDVNARAGDVEINVSEAIRLTNESFIANTVQPRGIGKAGNIFIATGKLFASGGAYLSTSTFGQGDAGNLNINARDLVSLDGKGAAICPCGGAFSRVETAGTVGQGGEINIATDILRVVNGTTLSGSTNGRGNAGSVNINARDAEFSGVGDDGFSGGASTTVRSRGVGEGGTINITASASLSVSKGAVLTASTFGAGPGGRIQINAADSVNIFGVGENIQSSGLFISTTQRASGQGGQITVNTDLFRIADGAIVDAQTFNFNDGGGITINAKNFEAVNGGQIVSTSRSSGKAGNITINANKIALVGTDATFTDRLAKFGPVIVDNVSASSGLFANTLPESTGDGSSILVNAGERIVIAAGAGIGVNSEGRGNTGNIELKSPNITLDGNAYLSATTTAGSRGNILLQSGNIQLRRGSNITTNASNTANGGNITINSDTLVALENSDIRANAIRGQGGNIQVAARGIFRAGDSDIDASSQLGINGLVQISRFDDPSSGLVPFEVNLASETAAEFTGCTAGGTQAEGSLYVTGSGGLPPNPGEALSSNLILEDLGNTEPPQIVEARALIKTPDGRILLVAEIPHTCR